MDFKGTNSLSRENLNYNIGTVKNIHYGDIHTKFHALFDITKENVPYVNKEISIDKILEDNYCKEGDIIFADASEDLIDVGKSIEIINLNNEKLLSGLHTLLARPKANYFHKGFTGFLFKSNTVRFQIRQEAQGTKVLGISIGRISEIELCFPSITEQTKIAEFLSFIDIRIEAQIKIIKGLTVLKALLSKKIFSQQFRFPEFNRTWKKMKLGEVCEIIGGGTPDTNTIEYWNGNIQWFTPTEIKANFVSKSERTITELGLRNSSAKILPKGTILLTTRATIGEASIALEACATNQGFQSLVVKKSFDNFFIFNWIKDKKYELMKRANGSTFPEISKSEIEKIDIQIPNFQEQKKISSFLSSVGKKVEMEKKVLQQYENHKKYLLQNMFI